MKVYTVFNETNDEIYKKYIINLYNNKINTKEYTGFERNTHIEKGRFDLWVDIENHTIFFYDPKFNQQLISILNNSWTYMDFCGIYNAIQNNELIIKDNRISFTNINNDTIEMDIDCKLIKEAENHGFWKVIDGKIILAPNHQELFQIIERG